MENILSSLRSLEYNERPCNVRRNLQRAMRKIKYLISWEFVFICLRGKIVIRRRGLSFDLSRISYIDVRRLTISLKSFLRVVPKDWVQYDWAKLAAETSATFLTTDIRTGWNTKIALKCIYLERLNFPEPGVFLALSPLLHETKDSSREWDHRKTPTNSADDNV